MAKLSTTRTATPRAKASTKKSQSSVVAPVKDDQPVEPEEGNLHKPDAAIEKPAKSKLVKRQYWRTNVYIPGLGTVNGLATDEQIQAFNDAAATSGTTAEKFLLPYDPLIKEEEAAKKRMQERYL